MFPTQRYLSVLALAVLATTGSSQVTAGIRKTDPSFDPIGRTIEPRPGEAGHAMCFGDGTGMMCPDRNVGAPGHGCENSLGMGGSLLWADGVAKVSQDTVLLQVQNLPRRSTVLFMQATGSRNGELGLPFGDGLMCMGGSMMKLGVVDPVGGSAVFPSFAPAPCFASLSAIGGIPPRGGQRYYQALYRDHDAFGSRARFNLSNAWAIEWAP